MAKNTQNTEQKVIKDFGDEWSAYPQDNLEGDELNEIFKKYFSIFPQPFLNSESVGFDMGCGSGRWAKFIAPKVKKLTCIDPSSKSLVVAKKNLSEFSNCKFLKANAEEVPLKDNSQDFGYSLGVLHHVKNTEDSLLNCVNKIKIGSPFLLYLYYKFDNRGNLYKTLWRISDLLRRFISYLPFSLKKFLTTLISIFVYLPLARFSKFLEILNINHEWMPLSFYRNSSLYTLRTDSLDRFGTKLEKRYTKKEIKDLMEQCGLENIIFSDNEPYWVAIGFKSE